MLSLSGNLAKESPVWVVGNGYPLPQLVDNDPSTDISVWDPNMVVVDLGFDVDVALHVEIIVNGDIYIYIYIYIYTYLYIYIDIKIYIYILILSLMLQIFHLTKDHLLNGIAQ